MPRCIRTVRDEYIRALADEVLVHVKGLSTRPEDADVEIERSPGTITLWLSNEFSAWSKAGKQLFSALRWAAAPLVQPPCNPKRTRGTFAASAHGVEQGSAVNRV
jgi:hypothetical protein